MELRRLVRTLTAQGRLSRWILTSLPIALALLPLARQPGYVEPLLHPGSGTLLLVIAALLLVDRVVRHPSDRHHQDV